MKILMIKRGALGDVLMTTPLIRQLKLQDKSISIDFLIAKSFKSVITNNPYINNIYSIEDVWFNLKNIFRLFKVIRQLRNKYDYVFVLDKHYYFAFMASLIGGKVIGFGRDKLSKVFLTNWTFYNDLDRYQVLYYLDLLKVTSITSPDYNNIQLDLVISDNDKSYVVNYLKMHNITNFVIVVNSGGNNQFETSGIRMLPDDKALYLIENLAKKYIVLLIGGNFDKHKYSYYCDTLKDPQIINLAGKLSLEQSAYIMTYAFQIYTTDCGAMHLAISQNVDNKMICFFGPTNPNHILSANFRGQVFWSDKSTYDENYQLYGKLTTKRTFFNNLNLQKLFLN